MPKFLRGARPSPRHRLAAARPHVATTPTPAQWLWKPAQLSMWLNDQFGDCVTAEEAFAKGCIPGVFITDVTVQAYATANNLLNGADLVSVIDLMETAGFQQDGKVYDDGPPVSVDWTNPALLTNAISQGPVKIGVAADQLETAVNAGIMLPNGWPENGWFATAFQRDTNEDHCAGLAGYGPMGWLFEELKAAIPDGVDQDAPGYAAFTWSSIGVIDPPSLQAICGECWLRVPTSIVKGTV